MRYQTFLMCALAILCGLFACTADVQAPAQPPAVAPPDTPAWSELWRESWGATTFLGWTRADQLGPCRGLDDPGSKPRRIGPVVGDWTGAPPNGAAMVDGALEIEHEQYAVGWSLISGRTFPLTAPLRVSTTVELTPDAGGWVGLTLHNGEGNYREIGIVGDGSFVRAIVHAPCYIVQLDPVLPAGPLAISISYDPAAGWAMHVDGREVYSEPLGYRNNVLAADPVVGLLAVNLIAESQRTTGWVRATVGPIFVEQGGM